MKIKSNPAVKTVIANYPKEAQLKLEVLRSLIIETAKELEQLDSLEETLKWGEPSYLSEFGSTIRIDWKEETPNKYSMYFKCTSKLMPTFKKVYGSLFKYENNRAIYFNMSDKIPEKELKECIKAALLYHKVKLEIDLAIPHK